MRCTAWDTLKIVEDKSTDIEEYYFHLNGNHNIIRDDWWKNNAEKCLKTFLHLSSELHFLSSQHEMNRLRSSELLTFSGVAIMKWMDWESPRDSETHFLCSNI